MSSYVGTFVMDRTMAIATVEVDPSTFYKAMYYSTLRLLAWYQRSIIYGPDPKPDTLKPALHKRLTIDEELHNTLLRQFVCCKLKGRPEPQTFDNTNSRLSTSDIIGNTVYLTTQSPEPTFYVLIRFHDQQGHVPLLCLKDL